MSTPTPDEHHDPPATEAETRKIRKRARRACIPCRTRKVRCDVVLRGAICTNCKLDGTACVVKPRARPWFFVSHKLSTPAEDLEDEQEQGIAPDSLVNQASSGRSEPRPGLPAGDIFMTSQEDIGVEQQPVIVSTSPVQDNSSNLMPDLPAQDELGQPSLDSFLLGDLGTTHGPFDLPPLEHSRGSFGSSGTTPKWKQKDTTVPDTGFGSPFIQFSFLRFIDADELWRVTDSVAVVLEKTGCLHVPTKSILDDLVRHYFLHIHPVMPLLNERDFWDMYCGRTTPAKPRERIPIFLFQALLFLACPYISDDKIHSLGFISVQDARSAFYQKAKILFDMYPHTDDVSRAQAALMLTYHAPSISDKTNSFWLSSAVHFAKSARAHLYAHCRDPKKKNVLKRLWWCCILRDRVMALGLRRQLQIKPMDFDFNQAGFVDTDFEDEVMDSAVYDMHVKQILIQLVCMLCELAVALGEVLPILYPETSLRLDEHHAKLKELRCCSTRLESWYEKAFAKFRIPTNISGAHESLILFTNMSYIYYNTAKASLCNHLLVFDPVACQDRSDDSENRLSIQAQMAQALRSITDDLVELENLNLSRYLPNTFIGISALPFIWQLLDAKVAENDQSSSKNRVILKSYADMMKRFRSRYESTDDMLHSVEKIAEYIKANEPLQQTTGMHGASGFFHRPEDRARELTKARGPFSRNSWSDMVLYRPQVFLRIAMTVDFSLSHGHFPSEEDFPTALRMSQKEDWCDLPENQGDGGWWVRFVEAMEAEWAR